MSHQGSFREGWRAESLAYYIISKFAFLDKPSTIGDDIGIDFYCTLFKKEKIKNNINLRPTKFHFAIQVKSNKEQFELKPDQISNLYYIHHPYFVGVINNDSQTLTIYANDAFDYHISMKWFKTPLILRLNSKPLPMGKRCIREKHRTILLLNKLMTFSLNDSEDIEKNLNDWKSKIQIMQYNISSRFNGKFVFIDPDNPNSLPTIVTGKDSFNSIQIDLSSYLQIYKENIKWFKKALQKNKNKDLNDDINKMLKFSEKIINEYIKEVPKYYAEKQRIKKVRDLEELISLRK